MTPRVPEYLVDTSVAIKWVVERDEADVFQAQRLLAAYGRNECSLSAPDLLFLEFANALTVGRRQPAARALEAIRFLKDLDLRIVSLQWASLNRAVDLAASNLVTVYDSYFLAVAENSRTALITADEAFLRRIRPHPNVLALRDLQLAG